MDWTDAATLCWFAVGNDCWFGGGAIVLGNVTIGDGGVSFENTNAPESPEDGHLFTWLDVAYRYRKISCIIW